MFVVITVNSLYHSTEQWHTSYLIYPITDAVQNTTEKIKEILHDVICLHAYGTSNKISGLHRSIQISNMNQITSDDSFTETEISTIDKEYSHCHYFSASKKRKQYNTSKNWRLSDYQITVTDNLRHNNDK